MADYNEQQAKGKAGLTDPANAGEQSSTDSQSFRQEDGYGSCCNTNAGKRPFHPWESDTWECESDEACGTSDASLNAENLETGASAARPADEASPRTFAARPEAAENTALWQDLVRSQQPETTDRAQDNSRTTLPETVTQPAMQWTLVDLGSASCDTPGCDPATCDSEDCQEDGRTSYKELPEYTTSGGPMLSYRFDLDGEPGAAPEPMATPEPVKSETAAPKKRGRKSTKAAAAGSAVFPEQATPAADPSAKPKRGAAKKGKATSKKTTKTAKKGAKKPAKAKKTTAKKAKKPTTPRGKKAAGATSAPTPTDPMMPTEKAA